MDLRDAAAEFNCCHLCFGHSKHTQSSLAGVNITHNPRRRVSSGGGLYSSAGKRDLTERFDLFIVMLVERFMTGEVNEGEDAVICCSISLWRTNVRHVLIDSSAFNIRRSTLFVCV